MLNIKHNFGINFAISSNQNPSSNEILLSMETSSGVTINTSAHVENNLTIGGILMVGTTDILTAITDLQNNPSANVDLTNYYTKTEIIDKISQYIYQTTIAGFIRTLFIKHINGIIFYVNDVAMLTLQDFSGATFYKNVQIDGTLTVGTTNIVSSITNLRNNASNYVLKNTNNTMTSNLTTSGAIQAFEVIATNELQSDGACLF